MRESASSPAGRILVMPDPLHWKSGIEYGVQALGHLGREGWEFTCYLADRGPMLEAVAFAILEQGLKSRVRFSRDLRDPLQKATMVIFPRVCPGEEAAVLLALQTGRPVLCSDPSLQIENAQFHPFERRDWRQLASILLTL